MVCLLIVTAGALAQRLTDIADADFLATIANLSYSTASLCYRRRKGRHLCDRHHSAGPLTVVFHRDTGVAMKSFAALLFALAVTLTGTAHATQRVNTISAQPKPISTSTTTANLHCVNGQ
jgi:hypothetical protein